jgi:zinc ribbon protein
LEILIALAISGITALFIALPFFLGSRKEGTTEIEANNTADPAMERINNLRVRKESLYSAIRDIDLDYALGKLTAEDYEELRQKYRIEAASVLKEIDDISKGSGTVDLDAGIEDEILKSRGAGRQVGEDEEIENEILMARKPALSEFAAQTELSCPKCGHESLKDDLFCSKCGAKLNG